MFGDVSMFLLANSLRFSQRGIMNAYDFAQGNGGRRWLYGNENSLLFYAPRHQYLSCFSTTCSTDGSLHHPCSDQTRKGCFILFSIEAVVALQKVLLHVVTLPWLYATWFERVSILAILLNCVTLGMFQPCGHTPFLLQVKLSNTRTYTHMLTHSSCMHPHAHIITN